MYTKNRYKSFTYNWSSYKNNLENKIIACQPIQHCPTKKVEDVEFLFILCYKFKYKINRILQH